MRAPMPPRHANSEAPLGAEPGDGLEQRRVIDWFEEIAGGVDVLGALPGVLTGGDDDNGDGSQGRVLPLLLSLSPKLPVKLLPYPQLLHLS